MKGCIGSDIKAAILKAFPPLRQLLAKVAECEKPQELEWCACGGKLKRAPSVYNLFIRDCLKTKGIHSFAETAPAMRDCARQWKQAKTRKGV